MTYRPRRIFAYSSAVLSWLGVIALLVVFSFIVLIVPFARARVYMCGRVVGWLVGWLWREGGACLAATGWGGCLWATGWGGGVLGALWARDRVGAPLLGVWVASRERACLCEVCGWVWGVEGVAFLEELFCF